MKCLLQKRLPNTEPPFAPCVSLVTHSCMYYCHENIEIGKWSPLWSIHVRMINVSGNLCEFLFFNLEVIGAGRLREPMLCLDKFGLNPLRSQRCDPFLLPQQGLVCLLRTPVSS